jgi:hypothetical protein
MYAYVTILGSNMYSMNFYSGFCLRKSKEITFLISPAPLNFMEARSQKVKCQTCHDFAYFQAEITLRALNKGQSQGCIRCKLLSTSVSLFRDRWSHLGEEEDASVSLMVTRPLFGGGLVLTNLRWPSVTGHQEDLAIQIMTEVCDAQQSQYS